MFANKSFVHIFIRSRDSAIAIATGYRLDGVWIEVLASFHFFTASKPALGPTKTPMELISEVKRV
jgi:hypothetical protein